MLSNNCFDFRSFSILLDRVLFVHFDIKIPWIRVLSELLLKTMTTPAIEWDNLVTNSDNVPELLLNWSEA